MSPMTPSRTTRLSPATQQGSSLLEVLVAVLIVSFGILGLVGLQAKASSLSVVAEDRTRAALIANEYVNAIQMHRTVTLPEATLEALNAHAKDMQVGGLNDAKVTINNGSASNIATVSLTWCSVYEKECAASDDEDGAETNRARYTTVAILP